MRELLVLGALLSALIFAAILIPDTDVGRVSFFSASFCLIVLAGVWLSRRINERWRNENRTSDLKLRGADVGKPAVFGGESTLQIFLRKPVLLTTFLGVVIAAAGFVALWAGTWWPLIFVGAGYGAGFMIGLVAVVHRRSVAGVSRRSNG
jgi:hypothetical protein